MESLTVVDVYDSVVGHASKQDVYKLKYRHRVVHGLIILDEGLLVQQRSSTSNFCPLHWSSSAQGHVRFGESYEEAGMREVREELGLDVYLRLAQTIFYRSDLEKFIGICVGRINSIVDINLDSCVNAVQVIPTKQIASFLQTEQCHPEFKSIPLSTFQQLITDIPYENSYAR